MRRLTLELLVCVASVAACAFPPKAAHASIPLIGLYEGSSCDVPAQNAAARNMLGRKEDLDIIFIDYSQTPEYSYDNVDYGLGCYKGQVANVALSVPLAFTRAAIGQHGIQAGAFTLADVLAGKLDPVFAHIARSAVDHGFPNAQMRLGWEMNGNWYLWAAAGRTAVFDAAFCRGKSLMQTAAPKSHFTFWLNPTTNGDATGEYPACIARVDSGVAWDQYESYWTTHATEQEPAAWNTALNSWWGVNSMEGWYGSARHAAPEFGVGTQTTADAPKTGDDPKFMESIIAYDATHSVEFMGLWDSNASYPGRISDGSHPGEALEVIKEWGAGRAPTLLKGAELYKGTFTAAISGCPNILVQLADGDLALLAWAPSASSVSGVLSLSEPRWVSAFRTEGPQQAALGRRSLTQSPWIVRPGALTIILLSKKQEGSTPEREGRPL